MLNEDINKLLADKEASSWEIAYRDYVQSGRVAIDDFLWTWIWNRLNWPEGDYSLFHADNTYIQCNFLGINILVVVGDAKQRRFVRLMMYESNPYHPDFDEMMQVKQEMNYN